MVNSIRQRLTSFSDEKYKTFSAKLIPNIKPQCVIGVKAPIIKAFAKQLKKDERIDEFLDALPHQYHEENILHAFLINEMGDFKQCIRELDLFLPFVDNWAVCDGIKPKVFTKNTKELLPHIEKWLCSKHTYAVRFGVGCLMSFYLDEHFDKSYIARVAKIKSDEYYINMMIAWYFATSLAKQWDSTVVYLQQKALPKWVHNKTIQKATESYRITEVQKEYLKTLKIKKR